MDKVPKPRSGDDPKYYSAYEDRYQMVYSQGIGYWSAFPSDMKVDLEGLDALVGLFRDDADRRRDGDRPRVLEPGCGEAPLAIELLSRGFDYVGVDLAGSALAKARERIGVGCRPREPRKQIDERCTPGRTQLFHRDVTDLSFLEPHSFDLALDYRVLHMLVVDNDRERYLAGLSRALRPGALVLFQELVREAIYDGPIKSFEQYMSIFAPDLVTLEERTAFTDGEERQIRLPRVPARPRSEAGYRRELAAFDLEVVRFERPESGHECRVIARYAPRL